MGDGISDGLKDFPGTSEEDRVRKEQEQMMLMLNLFAAKCGDNSRNHGFWQAFESADWLERLADSLDQPTGDHSEEMIEKIMDGLRRGGALVDSDTTNALRSIAKQIRLLEVGTKLMLICSELGEAFESMRDTGYAGHLNGEGNFGEELADVGIRLGDLAEMSQTSIGTEIIDKMAVNENRPHKHGRQA